jgi:hypothetical protein
MSRSFQSSLLDKDVTVDMHDTQSVSLRPTPGHDSSHVVLAADDPKRELAVYIDNELINVKAVDLYRLIRKMDAEQVLMLIGHSPHALDETHLALSLKRLYRLLRPSKQDSTLTLNLHSDHRFQVLCALLARKARRLEPSILADMITFLNHFGISSTHPAMQVCLQLAMKQINNLALDQLAVLSNIVANMITTTQTRVLIEAIKVLCQTRGEQLSVLSVEHRIYLLAAFGCEIDYADQLLRLLWRDRFDIYTWRQAISFFTSIGRMYSSHVNGKRLKMPERHRRLEQWCLNVLVQQLAWVGVKDIKAFLVACKQLHLYNGELLYRIGLRAVDEQFDTNDQLSIWSLFADLGHFHSTLSTAILESAKNLNCSLLSPASNVTLLTLIAETAYHGLNLTEYDVSASDTVHFSESAEQLWFDGVTMDMKYMKTLSKNVVENLSSTDANVLHTVQVDSLIDTCLCITALHEQPPPNLIEHILQCARSVYKSSSPIGASRHLTSADKLQLLTLLLKAAATTAEDRINEQPSRHPSVLTPMLKLAGLDVSHCYWTSSGLYADHLVTYGSSDQPSTAVFCWYHGHFWRNTNRLRCLPQMYVMTMQRLHHHNIVVVNANVWLKLDDREKLDYLTVTLTKHLQPITII